MNSVFHDGCLGVVTLVPSVRIILDGSAIKSGMRTPMPVRTRYTTYSLVVSNGGQAAAAVKEKRT